MALINNFFVETQSPESFNFSGVLNCECPTSSSCTISIDPGTVSTIVPVTVSNGYDNPSGPANNQYLFSTAPSPAAGFGFEVLYIPDVTVPSSPIKLAVISNMLDPNISSAIGCNNPGDPPNDSRIVVNYSIAFVPTGTENDVLPIGGHWTNNNSVVGDPTYLFEMLFTLKFTYCAEYEILIPYKISLLVETADEHPTNPGLLVPKVIASTHYYNDGSGYVVASGNTFSAP